MAALLYKYRNNNYNVSIFNDGTKIRDFNEVPNPILPEQIDLKCTNYCEGPCAYCHEQSNKFGTHGDLELGTRLLSQVQKGFECAIGGGSTLSHPNLTSFLKKLKSFGIISNLTINNFHLKIQLTQLLEYIQDDLVYGIGLSYLGLNKEQIKILNNSTKNLVFHLILGIHIFNDLEEICSIIEKPKILLLGYKNYGNGVLHYSKNSTKINQNIKSWFFRIHKYFNKGINFSFDNKAIEQLKLKRFFNNKTWELFFQGEEGQFSMYIDLVKKQFAPHSSSNLRFNIENLNIKEMFKKIKHCDYFPD